MEVTPVSDYWNEILASGETVYAGLIYRVPPRLWRPLISVQNELKTIDPRQLYSSPSTFHISVKGLGYLEEEVDRIRYERVLSRIKKILEEVPPFEIRLRGIGAFPTAIYAKVEDGGKFREVNTRILNDLKGEIDSSRYDAEEFVPHVNLASFNSKDVSRLLEKIDSPSLRERDFGVAGVYEIEAVRINLIIALGPSETQDGAFTYARSFWLGKFSKNLP